MVFCANTFCTCTVDNEKLVDTCVLPLARCVQSEINLKIILIFFFRFEIRRMCNIPFSVSLKILFLFRRPILLWPVGPHLMLFYVYHTYV